MTGLALVAACGERLTEPFPLGAPAFSVGGATPATSVVTSGDGAPDPNVLHGLGAVLNSINLGSVVGEGVVESNGLLH